MEFKLMDWNNFSCAAGYHRQEYEQASRSLAFSHGAAVHEASFVLKMACKNCREFYTRALAYANSEEHLKLVIEHVEKLNKHTNWSEFGDIEQEAKNRLNLFRVAT